jgi:hypothetical protein
LCSLGILVERRRSCCYLPETSCNIASIMNPFVVSMYALLVDIQKIKKRRFSIQNNKIKTNGVEREMTEDEMKRMQVVVDRLERLLKNTYMDILYEIKNMNREQIYEAAVEMCHGDAEQLEVVKKSTDLGLFIFVNNKPTTLYKNYKGQKASGFLGDECFGD